MDFGAQPANNVNGYGYVNSYSNQYMNNMYNQIRRNLPKYTVIKVNGRQGAEAFEMGPDSSIFLADEREDIIWFARTDGAGYKTVVALDVMPHVDKPQVDVNELNNKVLQMEKVVSTIVEEINNGKVSIGVNKHTKSESEKQWTETE